MFMKKVMRMHSKFLTGDVVMYSEKFLRQIGDYSKESADRRMTILTILPICHTCNYCKMVDTATGKEVLSLECNLEKAVAKTT